MFSTRPLIPKYSSICTNRLITLPSASFTIGITVTFMLHSFSILCLLSQGLIVWPRLNGPFVSQNLNGFCASHFLRQILGNASTIYWYSWTVFHSIVSWVSFTEVCSDSKSSQVSRTLLNILNDLNDAVVCIVSTRVIIFKSSSSCIDPLLTVPRAPIKTAFTVTFMFDRFLIPYQGLRTYLSFSVLSILICNQPGQQSLQLYNFYFFLLIIKGSGRLVEIRWSHCMSKVQRSLCVSFSRTDSGLCIYHLFVWSNLNFLHNYQWITLLTKWCPVWYSFYAFAYYVIDCFVSFST